MQDSITDELLSEIRAAGFEITDYHKLWTIKTKDKFLIPILLKYLKLYKTKHQKEFIIKALGVKGFIDATKDLLDEYIGSDTMSYKQAIADSLYYILDNRFENEYLNIIKDKNNSISRQMIVLSLGKMRSEKAIETFIDLIDDEEVNGHIIMALGFYNDTELIKYIEPFLNHEKTWIREEAKISINNIQRFNEFY